MDIVNILLAQDKLDLYQITYMYLIYEKNYDLADKLLDHGALEKAGIVQLQAEEYLKIINPENTAFIDSSQISLRSAGELLFKGMNSSTTNVAKDIFEYMKTTASTYLKKQSKLRFTPTIAKFLKERVNQGVTLEDAQAIIDYKFKEWWNQPSMRQHLNFRTLLGTTHFTQYLQQVEFADTSEESSLNEMG
jgi:uncharacterized phage protein (TIGR02220 family)